MKKTILFTMVLSMLAGTVLSVNAQETSTFSGDRIVSEDEIEQADLARKEKSKSDFKIYDSRGDSIVSITSDSKSGQLSITVGGVELLLSSREKDEFEKMDRHSFNRAKRISYSKKKYTSRMGSFEFGMNSWINMDYSLYPEENDFMHLNAAKSTNFTFNILQAGVAIDRHQVLGFSSGVGLVWNNYVFSDNYTLVRDGNMLQPKLITPACEKSKITTFSLRVPLTLDLNLGTMFFSGGVYGEAILNAYTKSKHPEKKDYLEYVNPFQAGLIARVGFGDMYLYGTYSARNFFEDRKGPDTQVGTVGLGFGF